MDIIKYIKNMFSSVFGKKTKMLEAKTTSQDENNGFKKNTSKRKEFIENNREEINPKGLNFAINQYLNSLIYQLQNEGRVNSYNALVSLGGISSKEPGKNLETQNELINRIENNKHFQLIRQPGDKDKPTNFFHIKANNYKVPQEAIRLYINTERKNVAQLSTELINELGTDEQYYFKFISDEYISKKPRSETLVVYTDHLQINKMLQTLEHIKEKNPQFFEKRKIGNPFMKKYLDGCVLVAPEVNSKEYITEDNKRKTAKSYNKLLSYALQDSFINAMHMRAEKSRRLKKEIANNEFLEEYLGTYIEMDDEQKYMLVEDMKKELKKAQERNPDLDIAGIEDVEVNETEKVKENEK